MHIFIYRSFHSSSVSHWDLCFVSLPFCKRKSVPRNHIYAKKYTSSIFVLLLIYFISYLFCTFIYLQIVINLFYGSNLIHKLSFSYNNTGFLCHSNSGMSLLRIITCPCGQNWGSVMYFVFSFCILDNNDSQIFPTKLLNVGCLTVYASSYVCSVLAWSNLCCMFVKLLWTCACRFSTHWWQANYFFWIIAYCSLPMPVIIYSWLLEISVFSCTIAVYLLHIF